MTACETDSEPSSFDFTTACITTNVEKFDAWNEMYKKWDIM